MQGKDDFLGRCVFFPKVRLKGIEAPEAKLLWHKVKLGDQDGGEILVDAELFLVGNLKLHSCRSESVSLVGCIVHEVLPIANPAKSIVDGESHIMYH